MNMRLVDAMHETALVNDETQGPLMFEVRDASKAFGGNQAIDAVSFGVRRGEFLAVLGPSGAGKTTLFRCLAGLTAMDSGSAMLSDADVTSLHSRERRRIAVVFQQFI